MKDFEKFCKILNFFFYNRFWKRSNEKIIAYGFILDDYSYLRDSWNWLDFIVFIASIITFLPSININLIPLRTFGLIRP